MRLKREREREREREGGGNFISLLTFEGEEKKGKKGGRGRKNEPVKRSLPASFVAAFFFPHPLPTPSPPPPPIFRYQNFHARTFRVRERGRIVDLYRV